jgi:membrane protease YdiL (CAAX protease family)
MASSSMPDDNVAQAPSPVDSAPRDQTPWRLLVSAAVWLLAGLFAQVCTGFLAGFVAGVHNEFAQHNSGPLWTLPPWLMWLLSVGALQLTLLSAAWRRSLQVGRGDRRLGLGIGPLHRQKLLVGLMTTIIPAVIYWIHLLQHFVIKVPATSLTIVSMISGSTISALGFLLIVGILAPLAEEWFFRGWLWTGLRHHWDESLVAAATGCLWLAVHALEGLARPLFLIPLAIFLSVARRCCGSVRASFILHLLNNMIFLGLAFAAR